MLLVVGLLCCVFVIGHQQSEQVEPRTVAPTATRDVAAMPPLDSELKHNCIHDDIQRQTKIVRVVMNRTQLSPSKRQSGTRVFGAPTPKNITIHVVHSYETENAAGAVNSPACLRAGAIAGPNSYTCRADDVLTDEKKTWLKLLLNKAELVLERSLLVNYPVVGSLNLPYASCGTAPGVVTTSVNGTIDADLIIFVTARPIAQDGVLAYASSCMTEQDTGRPIAGHLNYSPASLKPNTKLDGQLGTTLHEMTHILGFSSSLFGNFFNASDPMANVTVLSNDANGRKVISTKNVKAFVQQHFSCAAAVGGEVESDGSAGTAGSHWEKRIFQNEFMTGSSSSDPVYSPLTMAFFEDSGWYKAGNLSLVDDLVESKFIWGKSRGCGFLTKKCNSKETDAGGGWPIPATWPGYFCSDKTATACAFDLRGKARCGITDYPSIPPEEQYFPGNPRQGGLSSLADYCPFFSTVELCSEKKAGTNLETFGANSRCFVNSLASIGSIGGDSAFGKQLNAEVNQLTQQMGCYETFCQSLNNTFSLKLQLGGFAYDCPATTSIKIEGKSGSIKCPPQAQIDAVCTGVPIDNDFPSVKSVSPVTGQPGTELIIIGTGFKQGIKITVDVPCAQVIFKSEVEVRCIVASQENFKDPRHLAALSKVFKEKKSIIVENPNGRKAALVDAFELNINFDISAISGFIDLMVRNPMNTAIVGIVMLLGCLCCIYCMCSSRRNGGNNARSGRKDYGGYYF